MKEIILILSVLVSIHINAASNLRPYVFQTGRRLTTNLLSQNTRSPIYSFNPTKDRFSSQASHSIPISRWSNFKNMIARMQKYFGNILPKYRKPIALTALGLGGATLDYQIGASGITDPYLIASAEEPHKNIPLKIDQPSFLDNLKQHQSKQLKKLLSTLSDDLITALYRNGANGHIALKITPEDLHAHKNKLVTFLSKYNIRIDDWLEKKLEPLLEKIPLQSLPSETCYTSISLESVPQLIHDTKTIFKTFLPNQHIPLSDKDKYFLIKKSAPERRLITYTKLKQIIEEKKLSHVKLPAKFLVIKDYATFDYITDKQAISLLLDKHMTVQLDLHGKDALTLALRGPYFIDPEDRYAIVLFAEKITPSGKPLNNKALDELKQLIEAAPFDVGYGNIFTDENGDAIIIDTEFKGEPAETSIAKLMRRYRW